MYKQRIKKIILSKINNGPSTLSIPLYEYHEKPLGYLFGISNDYEFKQINKTKFYYTLKSFSDGSKIKSYNRTHNGPDWNSLYLKDYFLKYGKDIGIENHMIYDCSRDNLNAKQLDMVSRIFIYNSPEETQYVFNLIY